MDTIQNVEDMIKKVQELFKQQGNLTKTDVSKQIKFNTYRINKKTLQHFNISGSVYDIIGKLANINWKEPIWFKTRRKIITNNMIIKRVQEQFNQHGPFEKKNLQKITGIHYRLAKERWNSLDELAKEANIKWKRTTSNKGIGKNEKELLDKIELEHNIKLERGYCVARKYIDGYDPVNNIAYEIDEPYHKGQQIQDFLREQLIKQELGCSFVRIKDGW